MYFIIISCDLKLFFEIYVMRRMIRKIGFFRNMTNSSSKQYIYFFF